MKEYFSEHLFFSTLFALLALVLFVRFLLVTHISVAPWCTVYVEASLVSGDRAEIKKSLAHLRVSNPDAYQSVCAYVDEIIEKPCVLVSSVAHTKPPACYVRGTRTVYLARQSQAQVSIEERARLIGVHAGYSQEFWENEYGGAR